MFQMIHFGKILTEGDPMEEIPSYTEPPKSGTMAEITAAQLETLGSCPLFAGIDCVRIKKLLETRGTLSRISRRKPLTGYHGKLGILLEGKLLVENGSGTPLNHLEPGALFGVSTVFTRQKAHVTDIYAEEDAVILLLSETELQELFTEDFTVNRNYLSFLTGRIRFLNWKIDLFTASTAEQKLLCWIRHQCRLAYTPSGQEELMVDVGSMSHLAMLLGMGRASLYRAVDALTANGVIQKVSRKRWIIHLPGGSI